jgi:hypothetical protein
MFCKKCGAQLNEWVKFCSNCGCEVANKGEAKPDTQTTTITPALRVQENTAQANIPPVTHTTQTKAHLFSPIVFIGALLSMIAFFVPFFSIDVIGYTEETTYVSMLEQVYRSIESINSYSSNKYIRNYAPAVRNELSSLATGAIIVEIALILPVFLSFCAFLSSFKRPRRAAIFALLSGVWMTAMVVYVSSQFGDALSLVSDFTSLRIGVLLYVLGIIMTVMGPKKA